MKTRDFLNLLQHDAIVDAIKSAEQRTSGEIRVFVTRQTVTDPMAAAQAAFARLQMYKTRHHNAVLIFVAPRSRQFAVIGDVGVHTRCGEGFWREVADEVTSHLRQGQFTLGLIHGIQRAGELLSAHFPPQPREQNELSNDVAHD